MREIYLIIYSQVNADLFPIRESFVNIVCEAFTACNVDVLQWVCAKENHKQSGFHFHMTVKLKERHRWKRVGVHVNFSNRRDNYFSAWKYTTKEDLKMMRVRWRSFQFFSQIPQSEQVDILPCPRCFAEQVDVLPCPRCFAEFILH